MTCDEFIEYIGETAKKVCKEYDLPASVCISQACLESSWGNDAIGEFNFFGRKWGGWGNYIEVPTDEYYDGVWQTILAKFQDYDSLEEAVKDWCVLMTEEPCYAPALDYRDDFEAFTRSMGAIYATDPDYAEKILSTIQANDLTRFDLV